MAQQPTPDIQAILQALAARAGATPQVPQPPQGVPQQYPGIPNNSLPAGFQLPQPTNTGGFDLSSIKPISTGSVSLNDALAKARDFAAGKGNQYSNISDPRDSRSYRRSRSRSRSPSRRDQYSSYRDDRRDDSRRGYGRERSRSPGRNSRGNFSPQSGRNHGRDRSPRDEDSEVISIDSNLVGLVIGRQGENLRRVEQETRARIQFITPPNHPGPQRQCRISGPLRARNDAKREINRIIEENNRDSKNASGANKSAVAPPSNQGIKLPSQPVLRDGENSVQIMVPDRTVGLIIGRGGETIRDLQERSGCHINIVGVNKSVNGLRPVNLIGSTQAASKAKELIMEIVESDTRGPQGQSNAATPTIPPPSHGHPMEQQNSQGKITESIRVPSDAVGMIIGKGGETIKEMQSSTNCKINVSQASGSDVDREIGLVGTRSAIEAAKKAIWEKVDMAREKSNARASEQQGNSNNQYQYGQQQNFNQNYNQQQNNSSTTDSAADPYAAYGGYQNYVALWYASVANGSKQPGQNPPA